MRAGTFRSFAKLNLGLEVVGKLPGGYHELRTLFATLSLHDTIRIVPTRSGVTVRCDHQGVPQDETNIAHRAAVLMQGISGRRGGLRIEITKRIEPGGGLGGGSSNAATVLRALNSMWNLGLEPARLMDAARTLGADVPYFLVGGPALGLGRGDQIHPIALPLGYRVLVVQGAGAVSTAAVFKQFASLGKGSAGRSRIDRFLGGSTAIAALRNDLEPAALLVSPALDRVRRHVLKVARDTGARKAAMSGSGSSFFLLFDDATSRRMAKAALEDLGLRSLACAFVTRKSFRDRFVAEPA